MSELLAYLEETLTAWEAPVIKKGLKLPGLRDDQPLRALLEKHFGEVIIPPALLELYRWTAGTNPGGDLCPESGKINRLESIDEMLTRNKEYDDMQDEEDKRMGYAYSYQGLGVAPFSWWVTDPMAIDVKTGAGVIYMLGGIVYQAGYDRPYVQIFDSLEGMFRAICACYEQEIFYVDVEDELEIEDGVEMNKICAKYNEFSEYWDPWRAGAGGKRT